jgi:cell division protein FtsZ
MTINLTVPHITELKPRITVFGVGGAGGNAVNNMIESGLEGVEFVIANTDAQAMTHNAAQRRIQMGNALTQGLGAGSQPQIGAAAAEEALAEIMDHLAGAHMAFITAGMGGGTGTGAAPVIARAAKEQGILTVGVVTKPFQFEGVRRMQTAERGIEQLAKHVDTLIVIPNQNLFRIANEKTTFAAAFAMADQVLYSGVASITELMTKEGLINLDFADVRAIMSEMGKAMMGTGEATGEKRAIEAAEAAISNPLLDDVSMRGARGLLISITGGPDLTLYEVDEAATRIREEVDPEANIILGATFDDSLEGTMRVSVVATGLAKEHQTQSYIEEQEDMASRTATGFGVRAPLPPLKRPQPVQVEPEPEYAEPAEDFTSLYDQEAAAQALAEAEAQLALQPPVRSVAPRAPRMPAIDEFPPHARKQMQARQSEISGIAAPKAAKKKSLFERLAQGMGKQAEAPNAHVEPALAPKAEGRARKVEAVQSVAADEDDQLEIPAFLRRQAN